MNCIEQLTRSVAEEGHQLASQLPKKRSREILGEPLTVRGDWRKACEFDVAHHAERRRGLEASHLSAERRTVLVVDDHSSVREGLGIILDEAYDVLFAEDGFNALQVLTSRRV